MTSWTLVANGTAARIFRSHDRFDFTEVESFVNPVNRMHEKDLQSDRYGQAQSSASGHSESYAKSSVKRQEQERFAIELAHRLATAHDEHAFDTLRLVCGPRFLGLLRKKLSSSVAATVTDEVHKNLVERDPRDILAQLRGTD